MLTCLVICGGGGKTTIFHKNPLQFLDIDYYIWNIPTIKKKLKLYLAENMTDNIGSLYQQVMLTDSKLREDKRILLVHRPENALWLDRKILKIIRPNSEIHKKNIYARSEYLRKLAIKDWEALTPYNPIEYNNYIELEEIIDTLD